MFEISNRTMAYLSQRKALFLHIHFSRTSPSYINQEESKKVFSEKKEIFCYGICLSPSNPSTVIYTHTDSFHAFKWMLCFAVNICRNWFTAVSLTCLLTFCGISSSVQQFQVSITIHCMLIDFIYKKI